MCVFPHPDEHDATVRVRHASDGFDDVAPIDLSLQLQKAALGQRLACLSGQHELAHACKVDLRRWRAKHIDHWLTPSWNHYPTLRRVSQADATGRITVTIRRSRRRYDPSVSGGCLARLRSVDQQSRAATRPRRGRRGLGQRRCSAVVTPVALQPVTVTVGAVVPLGPARLVRPEQVGRAARIVVSHRALL
jgi:hypothetical protein